MTDPDTLPDAIRQLDDVVFELTKPRHTRTDTGIYTAPSLWVQMQQAVHGTRNGIQANTVGESRLPFWVTGHDWCTRVEKKVREWLPHKQGHTLTLLVALPEQKWTPAQTGDVAAMTKEVWAWVRQAKKFLDDESELEFRQPCPECGEQFQWRHQDGENVKVPAITITIRQVRCRWCGTEWEPEWFARLIGIDVDTIIDALRGGDALDVEVS